LNFVLSKEFKESKENKTTNLTIDYLKKEKNDNYILGTGDSFIIDISNGRYESILDSNLNLRTTVLVDINGKVNIPRLNSIYVEGL
mgnify:CR=1